MMDNAEEASPSDIKYLLRATPHGCLTIAWAYIVFSPVIIVITIAWTTVVGAIVFLSALPWLLGAYAVGAEGSVWLRVFASAAHGLLELCLHAPRALEYPFGLLSAEAEASVRKSAHGVIDYMFSTESKVSLLIATSSLHFGTF